MNYIKGFDALRAIAIVMVLVTHLDLSEWLPDTPFVTQRLWRMISGDFGVQLFFVISGFLITALLLKELQTKGTINIFQFLIRRALRLLPAFGVFLIMALTLSTLGILHHLSESVIYAVFYIYNFVPRDKYAYEFAHLWSLGVEEQFYIIWPFILKFVHSSKKLLLILSLGISMSCFLLLIYHKWAFTHSYFFERWFIPACCPILVGAMGAIFHSNFSLRIKAFSLKNYWVFTLIIINYFYPLFAPERYLHLGIFFQSMGVVLLLIWIVEHQDSLLVNILNHTYLNYIGRISYGLYMYQGLFLRTGGGSELGIQQFPLNILLTIILAIVSYEFIELKALKYKEKYR